MLNEKIKLCKKCGGEKTRIKNAAMKSGTALQCVHCKNEITRRWRANNQERAAEYSRQYESNRPPRTRFASTDARRQYREENLERINEYQAKYVKNNPEKVKDSRKKWKKNNPEAVAIQEQKRRAREAEAVNDLTPTQWKEIERRNKYRCVYCGKKTKLTMDHVTPLKKLGGLEPGNIVPACRTCNCKKHTGPPPCPVQTLLFA